MKSKQDKHFQRASTRFANGGRTVLVWLRVDRRDYEFARQWAEFHAAAFPSGTAEDQLEGYLNMALLSHVADMKWIAPPEIEALYPKRKSEVPPSDDDDRIPF
jgi:hypothetical protein